MNLIREKAYRFICRFGYLNSKIYEENITGFVSDDETEQVKDMKKEKEGKINANKWMNDFNSKMILASKHLADKYGEAFIEKS